MNIKQKTKSGILLSSLIVVLIGMCALLFGCTDVFDPRTDVFGSKTEDPAKIPAGYGRVSVNFTGGEARTAFPTMDIENWEITYTFTRGADAPKVFPAHNSAIFELEIGDWRVDVKANLTEGGKLVAEGSEDFKVESGKSIQVRVNLRGTDNAGSGTFTFKIETAIPADTEALAVNFAQTYLRNFPALGANLLTQTGYATTPYTETRTLPAGFYLLTVKIEDNNRDENNRAGYYAGKSVVIHVYDGLTTDYTMSFGENDYLPSGIHGEYTEIKGMAAPVPGEAPVRNITECHEYTGTIEWDPPVYETFAPSTAYTATITVLPKPGFTVNGVNAGFFSVEGFSGVTNAEYSGVLVISFPALHEVTFWNFDSNGNWVQYGGTVSVLGGGLLGRPSNPNAVHANDLQFAGWFMDEDCNNPVAELRRWNFADPVTGSMNLYARWLPNGYKLIGQEEVMEFFDPKNLEPVTLPNGNTIFINPDFDIGGEYFLTEDIDLSNYKGPDNKGWVPIGGDEDYPFTGIFDGNGCLITYLLINRPESSANDCIGFFGAIRGAQIRNVGVILDDNGIVAHQSVGGLVGNSKNSLIENCFVIGNITANISVGGITSHAGEMSIIRNCYTVGSVLSKGADVGGIVANICEGSIIENCYSTMTVITEGDAGSNSFAGGIVAWIRDRPHSALPPNNGNTIIRNCVALNPVVKTANSHVGRILGRFELVEYWWSEEIGNPNAYLVILENNFALNTMGTNGGTPFVQGALDWSGPHYTGPGHQYTGLYDGHGKTLTQLTTQSTYSGAVDSTGDGNGGLGWKFGDNDANPWKWDSSKGLPVLYWE